MLERDLSVMGAMDDEDWSSDTLDPCGILEDVEPVRCLDFMNYAKAAFHRTVQDEPTNASPGRQVY
eukprot:CAMPEP_0172894628 /NCGR_PEP_ID=MMETSP1075-20121228/151322_1 /TAXON_ID=2916 /ORGANISM="Ceratium fusus, Strain PA161109" /LENGTH=65 /DNA_ID=CAMNT_0013749685 /DNA_START=330 /DNA_END=527 /DNA_ORIENTATION=-